jgi:RNA polymerase-binding transcription factor DksA
MSSDPPAQEPTADELGGQPSLDDLAEDLAGIEQALERLEDGTYWTDELTGDVLPEELLEADPTARRAPPQPDAPSG